jgi:hypothetical protein
MYLLMLQLLFIIILVTAVTNAAMGQPNDSVEIKVNFLYGSKPAKGFKKVQTKQFGGIKGGHVQPQIYGTSFDFDFSGSKNHLWGKKRKKQGRVLVNNSMWWDTAKDQWVQFTIKVARWQADSMYNYAKRTAANCLYDYAVFGMRCAAYTYDVLSRGGLFKRKTKAGMILKNFYCKPLRKRLYRLAKKNGWQITFHKGTHERKWESDKGIF